MHSRPHYGTIAFALPRCMSVSKLPNPAAWRKLTMAKQVITSDQLYPVYGPYSHAVRVGNMIFLHGTVGLDSQGRLPGDTPGRADMVRQCEQTIANMTTALQLLGGSLQDVVKVRAFLPSTVVRHALVNSPLMRPLTKSTG